MGLFDKLFGKSKPEPASSEASREPAKLLIQYFQAMKLHCGERHFSPNSATKDTLAIYFLGGVRALEIEYNLSPSQVANKSVLYLSKFFKYDPNTCWAMAGLLDPDKTDQASSLSLIIQRGMDDFRRWREYRDGYADFDFAEIKSYIRGK